MVLRNPPIIYTHSVLIISCLGCNPQLQCSRVTYLYANHMPPFSLLCLCIWVVYTNNNCDSYDLKRSRPDMSCNVHINGWCSVLHYTARYMVKYENLKLVL